MDARTTLSFDTGHKKLSLDKKFEWTNLSEWTKNGKCLLEEEEDEE